ncbi:MAG: MFS transporter [Bacteroidetes bacterium]|nr:MFS transporter [Bacteroidota bacterium]
MSQDIRNENRIHASLYAAFFTTGLVESLLPWLSGQINFIFPDEHYKRVLTFAGLMTLALLAVLFSWLKTGKGRRPNLMIALLVILPGLLLPSINFKSVSIILLSELFLFSGSLFVQVSGLRFISLSPDQDKHAVKITLLYFIKSAGLITGIGIPSILSHGSMPWNGVILYVSLFFLMLSIVFLLVKPIPAGTDIPCEEKLRSGILRLVTNKFVLLVLGGLAVYSGAEYCLVNLIPFYFTETFGIKIQQTLIPGIGLFMFSFFFGRLFGVIISGRIKPVIVFLLSSILCIFGLFIIFIGQKYLSLAASVMIGLGASNIFPVLLSIAIERIRTDRRIFIGMMIGTVPLGALFPALMWAVADSVSIAMSFTVPVFCMFYVTWIAIMVVKRRDYW